MKSHSSSTQNDWILKTFAGLIAGFFIALAVSGLFFLLPLTIDRSAEAQLIMWLQALVWLTILSTCYLFRTGIKAWLWLTGVNLLLYALYFLFKFF
ncbi:hypothetical protein [Methylophaga nitratireducenticrescens]|uniref:Uncharacterized protein n=1 Tax=Methylophaga nitratireducenticrescens TaxID=754476 RepID=I1XJH6_METNJ|nr:hypothetical protein [Methylophaga nitratireducenticrescens]AFI84545.1 hypothetical protein Q7A_1723 [Methylophaga nitratireducenticrescens]AUZ84567.1 hypothetical protein CDW43_08240 [Methylophaga nitratireducenticrescens]